MKFYLKKTSFNYLDHFRLPITITFQRDHKVDEGKLIFAY